MKVLLLIILSLVICPAAEEMIPLQLYGGSAGEFVDQCSSVNRMHNGKASGEDASAASSCIGYIMGIVDMHELGTAERNTHGPYCIPHGVSGSQMAKICIAHSGRHPEQLHKPAVLLVANALTEAFPCDQKP